MANQIPAKKRKLDVEGLKLLIGSGSVAATIAFWSYFANMDLLANRANEVVVATPAPVTLSLPPLPTLVSLPPVGEDQPTGPVPTQANPQNLRSVSQPQQPVAQGGGPIVVQGNRSNGGSGSGATTTTRSS